MHGKLAKEAINNATSRSMFTFTLVYSNNKYTFHSSPTGGRVALQTTLGINASMVGNPITKIGRLRSLMRRPM
jgi:hypothetical protein